jgi:hypothetical protein
VCAEDCGFREFVFSLNHKNVIQNTFKSITKIAGFASLFKSIKRDVQPQGCPCSEESYYRCEQ